MIIVKIILGQKLKMLKVMMMMMMMMVVLRRMLAWMVWQPNSSLWDTRVSHSGHLASLPSSCGGTVERHTASKPSLPP